MAVPDLEEQPLKELPANCQTPYDFHKLFMSDKFLDKIVQVSKLYAIRKGRPEVAQKITNSSVRLTQAIMYLTGYLSPSNRRMFWEKRDDTRNILVKKAMSRVTFTDIIRFTYFVDTVTPDPNDRFWKVRPLFIQLNSTAKQYVQHPRTVSIDDGMIKYFGPHPLKQFMRGKPHRFGYKVCTFYIQTKV